MWPYYLKYYIFQQHYIKRKSSTLLLFIKYMIISHDAGCKVKHSYTNVFRFITEMIINEDQNQLCLVIYFYPMCCEMSTHRKSHMRS